MSLRWTHLCGLLWGCSQGADHPQEREDNASGAQFTKVLDQVTDRPHETAALCSVLTDPELHGECVSIGAERLAIQQEGEPAMLCELIEIQLWQDECFFIVAEKGAEPGLCASAGRFETDCFMHTWTRKIHREIPKKTRPGQAEPEWAQMANDHGFAPDDDRPWVALYRKLLGEMTPMDRAACDDVTLERLQNICRKAGLGLFHDRLNYVRDKALLDCQSDTLPKALNTLLDMELRATLEQRKQEDLCP